MKFQNPFFLCLILAVSLYIYKMEERTTPSERTASTELDIKLIVARGAFHNDRFEIGPSTLTYYPAENADYDMEKYNSCSEVPLNRAQTLQFIEQLENKGFWKLKKHYASSSSCTSRLRVTLTKGDKTQTVVCDDFERDCPALMQYIDKKVVEWEGNGLKRVYLPG